MRPVHYHLRQACSIGGDENTEMQFSQGDRADRQLSLQRWNVRADQ